MIRITPLSLAIRSLSFFRVLTLAMILGVAVATAVITGALMVGDSVRGSLTDLAVQRLGPVTHAAVSAGPFDESLAERLKKDAAFPRSADASPMLHVRGRGAAAQKSVPGLDIMAVSGPLDPTAGKAGTAAVNGELIDALNTLDNVSFKLKLSLPSLENFGAARDSVLANRSRTEVLGGEMEPHVERVVRAPGFASLFSLAPSQRPPRIIWLPLADLQEGVGLSGQVNTILFSNVSAGVDLPTILKRTMTLSDYGLSLTPSKDKTHVQLMSRTIYLPPAVNAAAARAAAKVGVSPQEVTVNLVNTISNPRTKKTTHYTTAAGVSELDDGTTIDDAGLILNQWAADELGATIGDPITFTFFTRDADDNLVDSPPVTLPLTKILPLSGLAADSALVPTFKGMTDVQHVVDWRPPPGLKIDQTLADEPYWNAHRAAPKLILNYALARKLWGDASGQTGFRIPADKADAFEAELLAQLKPDDVGLTVLPLKDLQLQAASGSTDFAGLFFGFSMFLVVSAVIILAALFRLGLEQRARQLGVLSAIGFSPRVLRGLLLREALLIAVLGGLLGLALAVVYSGLMTYGLRTWWVGATGTSYLSLHVEPLTLVTGLVITLVLVILTIYVSLRRILKTPAARLVAGAIGPDRVRAHSRRRIVYSLVSLVLAMAAGTSVAASRGGKLDPQAAYLLAGGILLVTGLFGLRAIIEPGRGVGAVKSLANYALRSAGYRPTRAILTASLIALASFTLVTVASMKQQPPKDPRDPAAGTGQNALILTADIPITGDLNTAVGRKVLGLQNPDDPLLSRAHFTNLRAWQGQDASCLNMTKPTSPTILDMPPYLAEKLPAAATPPATGPQMSQEPPEHFVPCLIAEETSKYILHLDAGEHLDIVDQNGLPRHLVISTLHGSTIFQSEVMIPAEAFRRLFPHQTGFSVILIQCPVGDEKTLAQLLESELGDFSVTIESTTARLARYQKVANTYLATFQALGSFGLLLGTIGVGVVLLRTIFERRAEIALLSALGYTPFRIFSAVFLENAALLSAGVYIGSAAAILGVLPAARRLNYQSLSFILAIIFCFGLVVIFTATRIAVRKVTPATLRTL
jgi:putative ABC transport system permease protein